MILTQHNYCECHCPKLCSQPDFWTKNWKMNEIYSQDKSKDHFWYWGGTPCKEDKSLDKAYVVWQENFTYELDRELNAGDIKNIVQAWVDAQKDLELASVTTTPRQTTIHFKRPCPLYTLNERKKNEMAADYPNINFIEKAYFLGLEFEDILPLTDYFGQRRDFYSLIKAKYPDWKRQEK